MRGWWATISDSWIELNPGHMVGPASMTLTWFLSFDNVCLAAHLFAHFLLFLFLSLENFNSCFFFFLLLFFKTILVLVRVTFDSLSVSDSVFQLDIFEHVRVPLVEHCLVGFNSSVFAYGQFFFSFPLS